MIRHEFTDGNGNVLVVFEGHEETLFWRRPEGIGYNFAFLTFEKAKLYAEQKIVTYTEHDSNEDEFTKYDKEATAYRESFRTIRT